MSGSTSSTRWRAAVVVACLLASPGDAAEPTCAPGELLADGNFELATGDPARSPAWVESSTRFVTPICHLLYCGTGAGSAMGVGVGYWAWFGGALEPETATLSQDLWLPGPARIELAFELRRGGGTEPLSDTLTVQVDGVVLASFGEVVELEPAAVLHTLSLDAFADGGVHTLTFEYLGPTSGAASFSVDNVSVEVVACLPELASDDFESATFLAWDSVLP